MQSSTVVVGSLEALVRVLATGEFLDLAQGADVVIVPTAAAFSGLAEAAVATSLAFDATVTNVEALMIADRGASADPYFVDRIKGADLVVLCDGSALHAKSVWHSSPVGEAIRDVRQLVAVGSCASVLGDVMIDPRGGAPTTGLGYRPGLAVGVTASKDQLVRTRDLLGLDVTLVILGSLGVVHFDGTTWESGSDDLIVTRGHEVVTL
jgi:cyanophycinase-like exopeptidase